MSDVAYTLVWTRERSPSGQKLTPRHALDVANNVTSLVRDPYPAGLSVLVPEEDGLHLLHVTGVSVLYEVIGFTTRVLGVLGLSQDA